MRRAICLAAALTSGCATQLDPNFALQMEAYRYTVQQQQQAATAQAAAEAARYQAISNIASYGDPATKNMALVALALAGRGGDGARVVNVTLPQTPPSAEDRAWKWAAVILPPISALAQSFFAYRTNLHSIDANRDTTIASYNALGGIAGAGFGASQGIAAAGFGTAQGIATAGFGALGQVASRPPISVSIGGDGVVGGGSFVGANSGSNSGNAGRISSPDNHCSLLVGDGSGGASAVPC